MTTWKRRAMLEVMHEARSTCCTDCDLVHSSVVMVAAVSAVYLMPVCVSQTQRMRTIRGPRAVEKRIQVR